MVEVKTKDIGVEVKECFRMECGYKWTLEEQNEKYIKRSLGI